MKKFFFNTIVFVMLALAAASALHSLRKGFSDAEKSEIVRMEPLIHNFLDGKPLPLKDSSMFMHGAIFLQIQGSFEKGEIKLSETQQKTLTELIRRKDLGNDIQVKIATLN